MLNLHDLDFDIDDTIMEDKDRVKAMFDALIKGPDDWAAAKDEGKAVHTHPVRVYRIEMPNGCGPYNSGLPNQREIYQTICKPQPGYDCARLAILNGENINFTGAAFRKAHGSANYGCDSMKSLGEWFARPAREYLKQYGAKVAVYDIPVGQYYVEVGRGEIIFNKATAQKVGDLPLIWEDQK